MGLNIIELFGPMNCYIRPSCYRKDCFYEACRKLVKKCDLYSTDTLKESFEKPMKCILGAWIGAHLMVSVLSLTMMVI